LAEKEKAEAAYAEAWDALQDLYNLYEDLGDDAAQTIRDRWGKAREVVEANNPGSYFFAIRDAAQKLAEAVEASGKSQGGLVVRVYNALVAFKAKG
jgi:hypothetical protein